jgi:kynurenine formamidase
MTKLVDLTHPWSADSVVFMGYPMPVVRYIKRPPEHGIYAQVVETPMHCGTHIDAPIHWYHAGKDMASIPLERLYGPGVVVDLRGEVEDWSIIKPRDVTNKVKVKERDVLIINTGYHVYYTKDEARYMCRHPGPDEEFARWALKMKLRWIGIDCASADHPMNTTAIPAYRPDYVKEFEGKIGKPLERIFPRSKVHPMHGLLFPHDLIHAENVGGDLDKLSNERAMIGAFPWRFVGGEACICRIVAFLG